MRQLVLVALTLIPLGAAAQAPASPAAAGAQATPGPQPTAIAPAPPASPSPAPAAAPAAAPRSYLFARVGALVPRSADVSGFGTGVAVEAGAGARLTRYLALEVGTGYLRMSQDETGSNASVGSYHLTQDLSAVPIVATARLFGRAWGLEGYALAGAGVYLWSLGGKVTSSQYDPYSYSETYTGFAAHFGAGVAAPLTRRLSLGIEAKYLVGQTTFLGRTSNVDSAIVTASVSYGF